MPERVNLGAALQVLTLTRPALECDTTSGGYTLLCNVPHEQPKKVHPHLSELQRLRLYGRKRAGAHPKRRRWH